MTATNASHLGNDRLLSGMILGVLAFWLFAQTAGNMAPTYAIAIVAFIRVGEKLLQRFGPRKPVIWGTLIVGASILLMPTYVLLGTYKILAIVAFTLFGIGIVFYATPSTDVAISNLPDDQAGSGSGIYKMASSLGASFGVAISAVIFTALGGDNAPVDWIAGVITLAGRQDNLTIREAALFAAGANLMMIVAAIIAILVTVPKGRLHEETRK